MRRFARARPRLALPWVARVAVGLALSWAAACGGNVSVGKSSSGQGGDPCGQLEPIVCDCAGQLVEALCKDSELVCPACEDCSTNDDCGGQRMCDFTANDCGKSGALGVCRNKPALCEGEDLPACGCDGVVQQNPCVATQAGVDLAVGGLCAPPAGLFACGALFCDPTQNYCQVSPGASPGQPLDFRCSLIPDACLPDSTCGCLASEPCGAACQPSGEGFVLSCAGSE